MLNFAYGSRIHTHWVNIDFTPANKHVKKVNLLGKLPFKDESFDVAYSSHFIEHLSPKVAAKVLQEIKRILKPNGIIRIVVPDFENMAQAYLQTLQNLKDAKKSQFLTGGGSMKSLHLMPSHKIKPQIKIPQKTIFPHLKSNTIGLWLRFLIKWCVFKAVEKCSNSLSKSKPHKIAI